MSLKTSNFLLYRLTDAVITDAVITTDEVSKESEIEEEFVHVPKNLKGYVIGMGGTVIKNIQRESGAKVVTLPKNEDGFTITGNEEQRAHAKKLISQKVVSCGHQRIQRNACFQHLFVRTYHKRQPIAKRPISP